MSMCMCVFLLSILRGGSSDIQREVWMEPYATPGADEPSATSRLIPQQTLQPPLDEPLMDRREGIMWSEMEELKDSFTRAGSVGNVVGLTYGCGSMGEQKVD